MAEGQITRRGAVIPKDAPRSYTGPATVALVSCVLTCDGYDPYVLNTSAVTDYKGCVSVHATFQINGYTSYNYFVKTYVGERRVCDRNESTPGEVLSVSEGGSLFKVRLRSDVDGYMITMVAEFRISGLSETVAITKKLC